MTPGAGRAPPLPGLLRRLRRLLRWVRPGAGSAQSAGDTAVTADTACGHCGHSVWSLRTQRVVTPDTAAWSLRTESAGPAGLHRAVPSFHPLSPLCPFSALSLYPLPVPSLYPLCPLTIPSLTPLSVPSLCPLSIPSLSPLCPSLSLSVPSLSPLSLPSLSLSVPSLSLSVPSLRPSLSPLCPLSIPSLSRSVPAVAAVGDVAAAPHASVRGGARGSAGVVRSVLRGLRAAAVHPGAVAGAADAPAAAAALPVRVRPALGALLLLRGAAGLPALLVGLRAAGSPVHLRQHQLLLLDHGHRALPVPEHRAGLARGLGLALGLPRRELGSAPGHHGGRRGSQEDWLRRLQRLRGLVLGGPGGPGSAAVDAADRQALGDAGLCDPARALHPHQEAHQQSTRCSL